MEWVGVEDFGRTTRRSSLRRATRESCDPGLADGDALGADGGGELDVFGPVDGQHIGAAGFFAVSADDIDPTAAGAEGLHEAGIIERGCVVAVEEIQFAADDVFGALGLAPLVLIVGEHPYPNIEIGIEQERRELVAGDADGGLP